MGMPITVEIVDGTDSALEKIFRPRSAAGVSSTLAPKMRMILRRSTEKVSTITATNG